MTPKSNLITLFLCITYFSKALSTDNLTVSVKNLNSSITTVITAETSRQVQYKYRDGDIVEIVCKRPSLADNQPLPTSNMLYWMDCWNNNKTRLGSIKRCFETDPVRKNFNEYKMTLTESYNKHSLQCIASGYNHGKHVKDTITILFELQN